MNPQNGKGVFDATEDKITMKRRGTNNKQVRGIQGPSREQPDSGDRCREEDPRAID
jgi:hypothetical protein